MNDIGTGKLFTALILLLLGAAAGYYFGFDIGWNRAVEKYDIDTADEQEVTTSMPVPAPGNEDVEEMQVVNEESAGTTTESTHIE